MLVSIAGVIWNREIVCLSVGVIRETFRSCGKTGWPSSISGVNISVRRWEGNRMASKGEYSHTEMGEMLNFLS